MKIHTPPAPSQEGKEIAFDTPPPYTNDEAPEVLPASGACLLYAFTLHRATGYIELLIQYTLVLLILNMTAFSPVAG